MDHVDSLIWHLNKDKLAWMFDDELPERYAPKGYWPDWLRNHDGRRPVILRGSREWRDATASGRRYAAEAFVDRVARICKLTVDHDKQYDNDVLCAIEHYCSHRWPFVRIHGYIFPMYYQWENGEKVYRMEHKLERESLHKLYEKQAVARSIVRLMRQIKEAAP